MNKSALLLLTSLLLIFTENTILITQPAVTNFANNKISYWYANFGVIHYNKPMIFEIVYTNNTLCNGTHEPALKPITAPTYLVVREGNCSYPQKTLMAQNLGAQGVIFASQEVQYSENNVILSDDGNGKKIKIAVLFVTLNDGEKLGNLSNAKIKVEFEIPRNEVSSVTIFLSASGRENYIFLRNFLQFYKKIQRKIKLNVIYNTFECQSCPEEECILQKTCCSFDFDQFKSGVGRYIVQEQFRQYKILTQYSTNNNVNIDKWFDYMDKFDKNCDNDWPNSEFCSQQIMNELGIGKLKNIDELDLIHVWRRAETKTGIISLPDLSVNGYRHTELLTAQSSFEMICASLKIGTEGCESEVEENEKSNKGVIIVAIVVSSIFLILLGIVCYKKIIRREITNDMSSRVSELVSKYASKVSEQKKKKKDKLMEKMTEEL